MVKSYFFAASIAVLLAGCSKDEIGVSGEGPDNPVIEGEGVMNISLKYATQSRANGDYEDGTENESKVKNLTVYFFDADKNYLGKGDAPKVTERPGNGENIEKEVLSVNVPANVVSNLYNTTDENAQAYVVAVLNGKNSFAPTLTEKVSTYEDFNDAIEDAVIVNYTTGGNGFLMTNSNYVDNNGNEMALTKITKENVGIKSTSVTKDPVRVNITVERVSAKVQVLKDAGTNAEILGWGLNVTNKKFYPVKEVQKDFYANISEYVGWRQYKDWTDEDDKRSHWAVDPNYTEGYVPDNGVSNEFNLLDFSQLIKTGETEYCFENTFHEKMQNRNSTTTAVIVAKFIPQDVTADADNGTWVNWNQQNFSATSFVQNVIKDANGKDNAITKYYYRIENPDADAPAVDQYKVGNYLYIPLGSDDFEISYAEGEDIEFGETVIGKEGDFAGIVLKDKDIDGFYTLPENPDNNEEWENSQDKDAKTNIQSAIDNALNLSENPVTVYVNGYSYYEVPLRHFNDIEVDEYNGEGNYLPKHLGRYGIVRNNFYKLTVKAITTPGKPITGKPIPTVDKDDKEDYFIDVVIEVLSWNVRNQNVEL